jgi:hypothetical protein
MNQRKLLVGTLSMRFGGALIPLKVLTCCLKGPYLCTCCAAALPPTVLPCCQLHALQGHLELLTKYVQPPGCTVQQSITIFDSSIPAEMIHAAMAGLELLARDASATSEAAKSLKDPLDVLGRPLLYFVSVCASVRRTVDMPPGAQHRLPVEGGQTQGAECNASWGCTCRS